MGEILSPTGATTTTRLPYHVSTRGEKSGPHCAFRGFNITLSGRFRSHVSSSINLFNYQATGPLPILLSLSDTYLDTTDPFLSLTVYQNNFTEDLRFPQTSFFLFNSGDLAAP